MQLFQIVAIACIIVGSISCITYLNNKAKKLEGKSNKKTSLDNSPPRPKNPQPVSLCLIVPAVTLVNIKENNPISIYDIEKLIDSCSYFLCVIPEEAHTIEQLLRLTNEDVSNVTEQREVYIRINIPDCEEMIGKKVPYILKRNLPVNGQGVVRKIACLEYLSTSGLENFNRI